MIGSIIISTLLAHPLNAIKMKKNTTRFEQGFLGLLMFILPLAVFSQTFTKVTTGPIASDYVKSVAVAWQDIDGDWDLDLIVTSH